VPVEPRIAGVVSVEHDGRPPNKYDGMCLTVLVTLDGASADETNIANEKHYQWLTVTDSDVMQHLDRLTIGSIALRTH